MMQSKKQCTTLRVSPKREKPHRESFIMRGDRMIKSYLVYRRRIKRMMKKLWNYIRKLPYNSCVRSRFVNERNIVARTKLVSAHTY